VRQLFAAFLLALASFAAQAAEPVVVVPYRVDYHGWFTIQATVNGQGPYDFIIDTGATQSLVFENLALIQNFQPSGGEPQLVLGLGSQAKFPTYIVGDIAVGPARLDDLVTVVLADWTARDRSPQGVLGLDFLSQYEAVFDRQKMELSLYPVAEGAPAGTERWRSADLKADDFGLDAGTLYTVEGKVKLRRVPFLFDLGASGTVLNRAAYGAVVRAEYHIVVGPSGRSGRLTDALNKSDEVRAVLINQFQVGKARWYRRIFFVLDALIFADIGHANTPFGLFGADLLHDRSFALDFADKKLFIGPKED
jgi:predicted aspartyl protease